MSKNIWKYEIDDVVVDKDRCTRDFKISERATFWSIGKGYLCKEEGRIFYHKENFEENTVLLSTHISLLKKIQNCRVSSKSVDFFEINKMSYNQLLVIFKYIKISESANCSYIDEPLLFGMKGSNFGYFDKYLPLNPIEESETQQTITPSIIDINVIKSIYNNYLEVFNSIAHSNPLMDMDDINDKLGRITDSTIYHIQDLFGIERGEEKSFELLVTSLDCGTDVEWVVSEILDMIGEGE